MKNQTERRWVSLGLALLLSGSVGVSGARADSASQRRPTVRISVYNDAGSVLETLLRALAWKYFLSAIFFLRPRFVLEIVRWNRRGSTSHLFDPNPRQDHDSFFKLPNALGRQDAHS